MHPASSGAPKHLGVFCPGGLIDIDMCKTYANLKSIGPLVQQTEAKIIFLIRSVLEILNKIKSN